MKIIFPRVLLFLTAIGFFNSGSAMAASTVLKVGNPAPVFSALLHDGSRFNLKNQTASWTVLYFYPKADTPGCTKQACAFRDNIKKITTEGAQVYGVSVNSVGDQQAFHKKHGLKFSLIADESGEIAGLYGAAMPVIKMARRWTFILDDQLKIRQIFKDVDPVTDAVNVAEFIKNEKNKTR